MRYQKETINRENFKIVILAAGIGSRLGSPFPKPLTTLQDGRSILKNQLDNIAAFFDLNDVTVVVGFKKDLIMESFPDLTFVYNQFFDQTNTAKSLLKALKKYKDKSVLWLNGDVVFEPELFEVLQEDIQNESSFIAVNRENVAEEEVKYTLTNGHVNQLSKIVENGLGEAVGINFIAAKDIAIFINYLEQCDNNDYFERGLELAIANEGLKIKAIDISDYACIEVDFEADLDQANHIFTGKS